MNARLPYMKQLDGLRALAILLTMAAHFLPQQLEQAIPWGPWGVRLFFVLSGFLITAILLRLRGDSAMFSLRQFYARRFLRIFPVFYLALFVTAALNIRPVRATFWWHLTYLSNIYFAQHGTITGPIAHFWSLAVEEQFYVVWPWLIVFLPLRWLRPAIVGTILLGPFSRLIGHAAGYNDISAGVFSTSSLDTLGMGALLALLSDARYGDQVRKNRLLAWSLPAGLGGAAVLITLHLALPANPAFFVLFDSMLALLFVWVVAKAADGSAGRILEWSPMVELGKISYGVYVYHNFAPVIVFYGLKALHLDWGVYSPQRIVLLVALSIVAGVISSRWFERPLNRLKPAYNGPTPQTRKEEKWHFLRVLKTP